MFFIVITFIQYFQTESLETRVSNLESPHQQYMLDTRGQTQEFATPQYMHRPQHVSTHGFEHENTRLEANHNDKIHTMLNDIVSMQLDNEGAVLIEGDTKVSELVSQIQLSGINENLDAEKKQKLVELFTKLQNEITEYDQLMDTFLK